MMRSRVASGEWIYKAVYGFLINGKEDDRVTNDFNNREVVVESMCGGRYELYERSVFLEFCGCTPDVEKAVKWLYGQE